MRKIRVIGYPRSGNTWVARLLGDCLQCNITGWAGSKSLASEGEDRINVGKYLVTQGHATPKSDDDLTQVSFEEIVLETLGDDKVIFVVRDPRSVAVSAKHYWTRESIFDTLVLMQNGLWPFPWGNGWENFMRNWEAHDDYITVKTSYEALHSNAEIEIGRVLMELGYDSVKPLSVVAERQSFVSRTKRAKDETLSYTPAIQQAHLRGGRTRDWMHEFTLGDAALAHKIFWPIMHEYGYEDNIDWWKDFEPMLRADEVTYAVWK